MTKKSLFQKDTDITFKAIINLKDGNESQKNAMKKFITELENKIGRLQ